MFIYSGLRDGFKLIAWKLVLSSRPIYAATMNAPYVHRYLYTIITQ